VAVEVAGRLRSALDVFLARKLCVPNQPDVVMGAIASGGIEVLEKAVIRKYGVSAAMIETVIQHENGELRRRERTYRGTRTMQEIEDRTVILIDDGLTTGNTMRTAVMALRAASPERIVVATPVGAQKTCDLLRAEADEVVCAFMPEPLYSVDRWYRDYSPIMDRDIRELLEPVETRAMAGCVH
jgi:putative phosphoribosyl transferase